MTGLPGQASERPGEADAIRRVATAFESHGQLWPGGDWFAEIAVEAAYPLIAAAVLSSAAQAIRELLDEARKIDRDPWLREGLALAEKAVRGLAQ